MRDRWATFDCYGTLIDWNRGIGDALTEIFPGVPLDDLLRRYHEVEPGVEGSQPMPYRDVLARCVLEIAAQLGVTATPDAGRLPASLPSWPPFPEVRDALRALRDAGWKLAVLSNTDPDLLAASLDRIGVPVEVRVTFADARSYKPAPGHWDAFFTTAKADRARHVHVAASIFHDIEPCARMGLSAVWINRLGETSAAPRAAELPDLRDLPETLERIVPS